MTKGELGPLLPGRSRNVGGGDQMPLPAGRRQELAGLLLARAGARDPGGVAPGLQNGFGVEDLAHFGPQSSSSLPFVILWPSEAWTRGGAEGDASAALISNAESATGSRSRAPLGPPVCAAKTRLAGG
jgi:hypothetical protein